MVLQRQPERQLVADALVAGRVTVADEHGFHHGLYAVCPHDGLHAFPARTVWKRDAQGRHIEHVDVRCSGCSYTWQPPVEELHLY